MNHKWGAEEANGEHKADGTLLTWWSECRECGAIKGGRHCQCGGSGQIHTHRFSEPGSPDCHEA